MLCVRARVGRALLLSASHDVTDHDLLKRASAEAVGTAFLVAAVVGSGIAAQRLSPGDIGLQLLENTIETGLLPCRSGATQVENCICHGCHQRA